jgi:nickel-dependent lactate racemase
MSIEKDIKEETKKFTFNKKLLEFIDMAEHLEERLKPGEKLLAGRDEFKLVDPTGHIVEYIYLELRKKGEEPKKILMLTCLGSMRKSYEDFFEDYRPSPESQRA